MLQAHQWEVPWDGQNGWRKLKRKRRVLSIAATAFSGKKGKEFVPPTRRSLAWAAAPCRYQAGRTHRCVDFRRRLLLILGLEDLLPLLRL